MPTNVWVVHDLYAGAFNRLLSICVWLVEQGSLPPARACSSTPLARCRARCCSSHSPTLSYHASCHDFDQRKSGVPRCRGGGAPRAEEGAPHVADSHRPRTIWDRPMCKEGGGSTVTQDASEGQRPARSRGSVPRRCLTSLFGHGGPVVLDTERASQSGCAAKEDPDPEDYLARWLKLSWRWLWWRGVMAERRFL